MTRTSKTFLLAAGRMTNVLLVIALSATLSRMLPRSEYGAFRLVLMIYLFASSAFALGLPQSVFYFFPRYKGGQRYTFMTQTLGLLAVQGGILSLGLYFGSDIIGSLLNSPQLPAFLRAFSPYALFMLPFHALGATMMSVDRPVVAVAFMVVSRAGMFCATVIPVMLGVELVWAIRCWAYFGVLAGTAAAVTMIRAAGGVSVTNWWPILKAQVRYAVPVAIAAPLGSLALYTDKFIVSRAFGPVVCAGYVNGAMELPLVSILTGSAATVMFPEMVMLAKEHKSKEILELWHRSIKRCSVMLMPFLGLLIFLAPETMMVLFGAKYLDSAVYFRVYLCLLPIRVVIYSTLAMSFNANWVFVRSQGLAALAAAVLCSGLVWLIGLPVFAAVGTVIAVYLAFMYAARRLSPLMGARGRQFLPIRHWLITMAVSLLCGLVAWSATIPLAGTGFWHSLSRLVVAGVIFVIPYLYLTTRLGLCQWRALFKSLTSRTKPAVMPGIEEERADVPDGQ